MSVETADRPAQIDKSISVSSFLFTIFSTRNLLFWLAVLAMNYTLSRPSPVDLLFIAALLITLTHIAVSAHQRVARRAPILALIVATWALSFIVASLPHLSEKNVVFELLAKTFAISIAVTGAFVSMSWHRRHYETFMRVYIVSCAIASVIGTIGFVLQNDALTWDGRARGLIDDPNMYGSFLIPSVMFCAYFLFRPGRGKFLLLVALGLILLAIMLSFSRIAQVATMVCLTALYIFKNRHRPERLWMLVGGFVALIVILIAVISFAPSEFSAKFMDRLTLAKSYDVGETGRYTRYMLVLPMIMQNPLGLGVLQLEKIFPEPIHNIWLSSFVNYGWVAGFTWITLVVSSIVISILNYRRTRSDLSVTLLISLIGLIMCTSLHEGEHWRHLWLFFGLVWGFCTVNFEAAPATSAMGRNVAAEQSRRRRVTPARAQKRTAGARNARMPDRQA